MAMRFKYTLIRVSVLVLGGMAGWAMGKELSCGTFEFPYCKGEAQQFDADFKPSSNFGGFGGAAGCHPRRTPVIFIHGNADSAIGWNSEAKNFISGQKTLSVYNTFTSKYDEKEKNYQECELFGLSYLSDKEKDNALINYNNPVKYKMIIDFIESVKKYTGASEVDIVAHSLGVSMTMAALTYQDATKGNNDAWGSVRRFVNIAGGIRGLDACNYNYFSLYTPASIPTCDGQHYFDSWSFGFYADHSSKHYPLFERGHNEWTAAQGQHSLRQMPQQHPRVAFYTISAGIHDELHCSPLSNRDECITETAFEPAPNVRSQLDIGTGATASSQTQTASPLDFLRLNLYGDDRSGIGHFNARNQAGEIILKMLSSDCGKYDASTGKHNPLECTGDYKGIYKTIFPEAEEELQAKGEDSHR